MNITYYGISHYEHNQLRAFKGKSFTYLDSVIFILNSTEYNINDRNENKTFDKMITHFIYFLSNTISYTDIFYTCGNWSNN